MSLKDLLTKEILVYEHSLCGNMQKIADKLEVSVDSVYKYMKLHGLYLKPLNKYTCDHDLFKTDSEISFYLAGFIAADGSLQKRKYSKILKITLSEKDLIHLKLIRNLFKSNHIIRAYMVKPNKLVKSYNRCIELQITSNSIFDDLKRFNIIPNKTKVFKLPEGIINHELINHFIRGYFDGDGTIGNCGLMKGRKIRQKAINLLGTREFIEQFQSILIKNCLINKNKIVKVGNIYRIGYSGNRNIKNIYKFLYKGANIYLQRKKDKFTQ